MFRLSPRRPWLTANSTKTFGNQPPFLKIFIKLRRATISNLQKERKRIWHMTKKICISPSNVGTIQAKFGRRLQGAMMFSAKIMCESGWILTTINAALIFWVGIRSEFSRTEFTLKAAADAAMIFRLTSWWNQKVLSKIGVGLSKSKFRSNLCVIPPVKANFGALTPGAILTVWMTNSIRGCRMTAIFRGILFNTEKSADSTK